MSDETDVHTEHCCDIHGCKYGNVNNECTVQSGLKKQSHPCYYCREANPAVCEKGWKSNFIMVDVEADGPIPGPYSMVSFGAVIVEDGLNRTFYSELKPISDMWAPEALAVSGHSREKTLTFADPAAEMSRFEQWIKVSFADDGSHIKNKRKPMFIADNNGFDWQWINWYFHKFLGRNPFGFSSTNLGSLYKGQNESMRVNFKHLRKTKHTHHPVDDAKGNAEAFIIMMKMGLKL